MGRRKLEMKRIEDKNSRLITFSKRRAGLIKKARQLSVLCDVDAAVVVVSAAGKPYEFCSGGTNSVEDIVSRYQKSCVEGEGSSIKGAGRDHEVFFPCTRYRTCKELLQRVDRVVEETNTQELSVTDMTELEEELAAALMQTRSRKTQLMMEHISSLQEEERKLREEKEEMENQVASGKQLNGAENDDEGVGGLNDLATNQINPPQLRTLPLFNG